jgi:hypothetical protein
MTPERSEREWIDEAKRAYKAAAKVKDEVSP